MDFQEIEVLDIILYPQTWNSTIITIPLCKKTILLFESELNEKNFTEQDTFFAHTSRFHIPLNSSWLFWTSDCITNSFFPNGIFSTWLSFQWDFLQWNSSIWPFLQWPFFHLAFFHLAFFSFGLFSIWPFFNASLSVTRTELLKLPWLSLILFFLNLSCQTWV